MEKPARRRIFTRMGVPTLLWCAVLFVVVAGLASRISRAQTMPDPRLRMSGSSLRMRLRIRADAGTQATVTSDTRTVAPQTSTADAGPEIADGDASTDPPNVAGTVSATPPPAESNDPNPTSFRTARTGDAGGVPTQSQGRYRSPFANPNFGNPANVRVGFLLSHARDFDVREATFEADFFLSLTSDAPMPAMNPVPINGHAEFREVIADTPTFKLYRFIGRFSTDIDLHDYPFDTQELRIEVEDDSSGSDTARLVPDREHTQLDTDFNVPGWDVVHISARTMSHYFPDRFDNDDLYYTRYVFRLGIRRFSNSAIFTVFVPAIVIVLISLSGLWLPRAQLEVRSNATSPMLAAAVLFHYGLMQSLPATSYLTRADKLMMAVYVSLGLHMLISWMWFVFDEKHTDLIYKLGKRVGAPLTGLLLAAGMWL